MDLDKVFIDRCLCLPEKGAGNVSPNPMVGAVVVYNNKIIGEGYHRKYGSCHAEVNAINTVKDKGLLKQSTIYVSLEPCSHYGKTPPCAKLIIESGIKRCVICNFDPNPKVSGRGISMMKEAGIEVICDVEKEKGRYINRRFFCYQEKKRPYIILKCAYSKDGFMDINEENAKKRQHYWITNDYMKVFSHKLRAENDAIMVGYNTAKNDNPQLNIRLYSGNNPLRVVYDRDLTLDKNLHLFDNSQNTIVFNAKENIQVSEYLQYIKIESEDVNKQILQYLYNIGVNSIIIEGGKKTLNSFIKEDLWDEAYMIEGSRIFGKGIKKPAIDAKFLKSTSIASDNRLLYFCNDNAY